MKGSTGSIYAVEGFNRVFPEESRMREFVNFLWRNEEGQDIAEYAVMLAVILVIVIGTVRLIGSNANNVFSQVSSQIGQ